jgi:glycosyltransferase involved in cell wall biosynthesis
MKSIFIHNKKNNDISGSICLNMIVRNEAHVIERLLKSVENIIDYFVIVDTGSTDQTVNKIIDYCEKNKIPGEIHFRPWVNFGHNRQEAFELAVASKVCEKLLIIDADDELVIQNDQVFRKLTDGCSYMLYKHYGAIKYAILSILDITKNDWRWMGPVHEYLECVKGSGEKEILEGAYIRITSGEGGRSKNKTTREKYLEDAKLLEEALRAEPNNSRYAFYLAQSYRDAGEDLRAFKFYEKRAFMPGWDQETFIAMYEMAKLSSKIGADDNEVKAYHLTAWKSRSHRIEPLWHLARFFRHKKNYHEAYVYSKAGLGITKTEDILFVNQDVYDWMLLDEFSISAYWIGHKKEARDALVKILENNKYHPDHRIRLIKNLSFM